MVAVGVERRHVAGVEPAVGAEGVRALAAEIALDHRRPAHFQPADGHPVARQLASAAVDDLHLHAEGRMALAHFVIEFLLMRQIGRLGRRRTQRAKRTHLGHAPGMDHLDAVLGLEGLDHRARAGRAADQHSLQIGQRLSRFLQIVQHALPHRRHRRGHRHLFVGEKLAQRSAVQLGARHDELGAGHRRGEGDSPGVGVEHRHHRQDRSRPEKPSVSVPQAIMASKVLERWL